MKRKSKRPLEEDPIEQWKEWQNNMYNPGYYTGGRIAPIYKSKTAAAGALLIISALIGLSLVVVQTLSGSLDLSSTSMIIVQLSISLLTVVVGGVIFFRYKKAKTKNIGRKH